MLVNLNDVRTFSWMERSRPTYCFVACCWLLVAVPNAEIKHSNKQHVAQRRALCECSLNYSTPGTHLQYCTYSFLATKGGAHLFVEKGIMHDETIKKLSRPAFFTVLAYVRTYVRTYIG